MSGIGVIYNPRSGKNLRDPRAAGRLARALGDHGVVREAGSLDQLYRVAEDFRRLGIDVLGISGGDGTNGVTITGFLDVYAGSALPQLAFLRGGTMNTVANSVGIRRGPPEGLLHRLIQAYVARASRPLQDVERHVLRISGEPRQAPDAPDGDRAAADARSSVSWKHATASMHAPALATKYGFIFGTGVVCGFLSEYYRGGPPNPVVAAKTLLRGAFSAMVGGATIRRMAEPFSGSVELEDGTTWQDREYLAIAGGTIDQIGLNFRPFHRFAEREGAFHVLGIHTSPLGIVRQLPRIWRAAPMDPGHAFEATTTKATLRASGGGPIRYMIDGDLQECDGPLHVEIGPRVRIVVGT